MCNVKRDMERILDPQDNEGATAVLGCVDDDDWTIILPPCGCLRTTDAGGNGKVGQYTDPGDNIMPLDGQLPNSVWTALQ